MSDSEVEADCCNKDAMVGVRPEIAYGGGKFGSASVSFGSGDKEGEGGVVDVVGALLGIIVPLDLFFSIGAGGENVGDFGLFL